VSDLADNVRQPEPAGPEFVDYPVMKWYRRTRAAAVLLTALGCWTSLSMASALVFACDPNAMGCVPGMRECCCGAESRGDSGKATASLESQGATSHTVAVNEPLCGCWHDSPPDRTDPAVASPPDTATSFLADAAFFSPVLLPLGRGITPDNPPVSASYLLSAILLRAPPALA
jgi:hypothetical protein